MQLGMNTILNENKIDITLRDYQEKAVDFLKNNDGKLILAMCPSSGKTETIIYYLNELINLNPKLKVLILPHSTNVLLDNFYQRLELRNVDFTYSTDINDDVNVHIILPQNHNKIVGHYDLIIVDEAHENYLAKTIQGIIKKTQADKEILLTGTPSKFIGNNDFKLHFVALSNLCELYTPKLRIDILESDYDWNGNYNNHTKELKNSYKFSKESTEISLKKTFDFLLKRNNSDSVEKTLIVCRNIAQSNYVKNYLTSIGFSSEISNSDNDKDSENVSKFKNNLIDILIVVNRARLGYDDADLINLIDISGTLNPNIIYQMFARLLRGTQDMNKYYIRLTSKNDDVYNSEIATSVALMLTHTNYIKLFNGKNFNSQEIIVDKDFFIKSKKSLDKSSGKSKSLSKRKLFIDVQEDNNFDVINFFKEVIEKKERNVGLYKFCKVKDVLYELALQKGKSRTLEDCIEDANKYKSVQEWRKNSPLIYGYVVNKKWLTECTANLIKTKVGRTKEECIEDAKKYKTCADWIRSSPKIYGYAVDKKWVDECKLHLQAKKRWKLTLEECIEDAKKYKSLQEWKQKNKGIYEYCQRKKWLKDCTIFLERGSKTRTLEECIEDAKKYKTKKEWQKNSKTIYYYVTYERWFKEINNHFGIKTQDRKLRTKEECIEDAKKYKSSGDWQKNSPSIYVYASNKKWLKECSAHFIRLNGKTRTLEECIEDAKKYKSSSEWKTNSPKIYGYAINKKWIKECSAHFIRLNGKTRTLEQKFTLEECIEDARKYNNRKEWSENSHKIFTYGYNKWKKECTAHFVPIKKSHNISKNECILNAKKYKSLSEWKKNDLIYYNRSYNMCWYKECSAHFINLRGKSRTKQECIDDVKKYETKREWIKNSSTIYNYVRDKKWLEECLEHFKK